MFSGLFQPMHLLIILVIALIFFGPGKLPELGAGIGKSLREFKKGMSEVDKPLIKAESGENKKADQASEERTTV